MVGMVGGDTPTAYIGTVSALEKEVGRGRIQMDGLPLAAGEWLMSPWTHFFLRTLDWQTQALRR